MSCPSEPCHRAKSVQLVWSSRTGRCGDTWNTSKRHGAQPVHSRCTLKNNARTNAFSKKTNIRSVRRVQGTSLHPKYRPGTRVGKPVLLETMSTCQHVNMSTCQHHVNFSITSCCCFNRFSIGLNRLLHFATGICLVAQLQQLRSRLTSILTA